MRNMKVSLVAAAIALALITGVAQEREPLSGLEVANFDRTVRPQDDLFRFVNGGWLARRSHGRPSHPTALPTAPSSSWLIGRRPISARSSKTLSHIAIASVDRRDRSPISTQA